MDCRAARRSYLEQELRLGPPAARTALDRHLGRCSACRSAVALERGLTADLAALRVDPPFAVDIRVRLAAELAGRAPGVPEVGARELGWSLAAAAAFAAILVFGAWRELPAPATLARDCWALLSAAASAVAGLFAPLQALFASGFRLLGELAGATRSLLGTLHALEPAATAAILACTAMMAAGIGLVLGRDLMRPHRAEGEERR